MKKIGIFLGALVMVIGLSVWAQAALVDMQDGTIYDTDTQLSWLTNISNGYQTWNGAVAWAASLNNNGGFAGLPGWRLPNADPTCGANYNCINSEMGYLYYVSLGNSSGALTNKGPFINLGYYYWSNSESDTLNAWFFEFDCGCEAYAPGYQGISNKGALFYAWAVRPGARSLNLTTGGISGTVTDGTNPVPGMTVYYYNLDTNSGWFQAFTDALGNYLIDGLAPGNYNISFGGNNVYVGHDYANNPVTVTSGVITSNINGVLAIGGGISGTVTDGTNPISGITVYYYNLDTNSGWFQAYTDASGNYSIEGLAPGNYNISFGGNNVYAGHDYANNPVTVISGVTTSNINAVLLRLPFSIAEFAVPTPGAFRPWAGGITEGPDGNIWFTENNESNPASNKIGRMTPNGVITEFSIPTPASMPYDITTGPDGNLWFTEHDGKKVGMITPAGAITEYSIPSNSVPGGCITRGPDGNLWFGDGSYIGRISTAGHIDEFPVPGGTECITTGPDGRLWFSAGDHIGSMNTSGQVESWWPVSPACSANGIALGPDGNIWFSDVGCNNIGRMTAAGNVTAFGVPTANSWPQRIIAGPDGNLWFTEQYASKIGMITPAGVISDYSFGSWPFALTTGPDHNIWMIEVFGNSIVKLVPNTYTVTATAGSNGGLDGATPSPQVMNYNGTTSFKFNANTGYHVAGISGCGTSYTNTGNAVNTYTATTGPVTADCSVSATFAINTYTVTATAGSNGGLDVITPSPQNVNYNGTTSFKFNANTGYHVAGISGCGISYTNTGNTVNTYTATTGPVTADCSVSATFAIDTYTVTATAGSNGSLDGTTLSPQNVNYNGATSFKFNANTGYHVAGISGCGISYTNTGNAVNTYTATTGPVTADCTMSATFAINTYTVTPSAGSNGSISPNTPQTVNYNSTTTFTVTPNAGYQIASVTGCGVALYSGNIYKTGAITSDCGVTASFSAVNASAKPTASFSTTVSGPHSMGVSVTSTSKDASGNACTNATCSYAWTFTGGSPATATTASSSTAYSSNGTYSVTLTVTDKSVGTTSTTSHAVIVAFTNTPPVVTAVAIPDNALDATLAVTTNDADGDTVTVSSINWGDGTVVANPIAPYTHTYSMARQYNILVSVTDGFSSVITHTIFQTPHFTITGNAGLPGVHVNLKEAGHTRAVAVTGPDGSYSLNNIIPGTYTIEPYKSSGYGVVTFNPASITATVGPNSSGNNFAVVTYGLTVAKQSAGAATTTGTISSTSPSSTLVCGSGTGPSCSATFYSPAVVLQSTPPAGKLTTWTGCDTCAIGGTVTSCSGMTAGAVTICNSTATTGGALVTINYTAPAAPALSVTKAIGGAATANLGSVVGGGLTTTNCGNVSSSCGPVNEVLNGSYTLTATPAAGHSLASSTNGALNFTVTGGAGCVSYPAYNKCALQMEAAKSVQVNFNH